jgi:Protein of unknown function (DUF3631)
MHRSPNQLKPFDETDRAFIIVREAIGKWAARCNLSISIVILRCLPASGVEARTIGRCLVAIADDLGFDYDEAARAAAVVLGSDRQYENQHITLLIDIRNRYDKDRLRTKAELIPALAGLEDSPWGEWTGLDGTAGPHMLTQGDIGRLLPPGRRTRRAERLDPVVAEQGLGATEPDGSGIVAKQRVEGLDVVRHQRTLIAVECAPHLGDDIRQIDFHEGASSRLGSHFFEPMARSPHRSEADMRGDGPKFRSDQSGRRPSGQHPNIGCENHRPGV